MQYTIYDALADALCTQGCICRHADVGLILEAVVQVRRCEMWGATQHFPAGDCPEYDFTLDLT